MHIPFRILATAALAIAVCSQSCNNEAETPAPPTDTLASDAKKDQVAAPMTSSPDTASSSGPLDGRWELDYISGPRIAFTGLYPNKKPSLEFAGEKVTGNSSCNNLSGEAVIDSNAITFSEFVITKMACPGQGEMIFLQTIKKINRFAVTGDTTLNLLTGDIALMRFKRLKN